MCELGMRSRCVCFPELRYLSRVAVTSSSCCFHCPLRGVTAQIPCSEKWRTKLCPPGSNCDRRTCTFAHHVGQLRQPIEVRQLYDEVWADGVDWWFGQTMQQAQLERFLAYYNNTPVTEVPAWAHGLRYVYYGLDHPADRYLMWDFGLTQDAELLVSRRGGLLPFEYMRDVWKILEERKLVLGVQQQGPCGCMG